MRAVRARWAVAAALVAVTACTAPPGGKASHPQAPQPADAFSMAQPRCDAQGKDPQLSHKEQIRNVRIGGQPLYRGASIICE